MSLAPATTIAANGPPPDLAVALCPGEVMHARLKPVGHRFAYRIASILVDIDRLAEAGRRSRLFSIGRLNLFSFHEKDHGAMDGSALRPWVDRELARAALAAPADKVLLLASPRVLGYVFNPISIFFCFDREGRPLANIYEVRNTFGERHTYVAPIEPGDLGPDGIRQEREKLFHVSPFLPMGLRYRFRILPPGRDVRVRILETDRDGPILSATHVARVMPLTSAGLARSFLAVPWVSLKIIGAIHYEALRLWLKGLPFFRSPPTPVAVSYRDGERPPTPAARPDLGGPHAARTEPVRSWNPGPAPSQGA